MFHVASVAVSFSMVLLLVSGCAGYGVGTKDRSITAQRIIGPAGALYVDDGGSGGIPVVFVHSFAGSKAHWLAQLTHLRKSRRAVALDLRGHGDSSRPAHNAYNEYAVESLAADIAAVADGLGLKRFVLVGHSMGAAAAIAYAGAHPERVAGLVLVGAPGKSPPEQSNKIMASLEVDYEKLMEDYRKSILIGAQPKVERQLRAEMKSMPRDASLAIIDAVFAYDPMLALNKYPGLKLLLDTPHGESPGSLHNLAPNIPRRVVTGTSHWPHLDKPKEFYQLLNAFLVNIS